MECSIGMIEFALLQIQIEGCKGFLENENRTVLEHIIGDGFTNRMSQLSVNAAVE